jgi:hypothetical protein
MQFNESVKEYIDRVITEMLSSPREEPKRRKKRVEKTRQLLNEAVKSLHPSLRQKGWLLVEHLDKKKINLSRKGELIHHGELIQGSHINDLMSYAMRKPHKSHAPIGFSEFFKQLQDVPDGIISHRHRAIKRREPMDTSSV